MKNNTVVYALLGVLLAGLVGIYILHFSGSKSAPVTAPVVKEGGITVAYVNTDSLMAKYQYAIDLQADLEKLRDQKTNEYQGMISKFQNDAEAFQSDYQNYLQTGANLTLTQQQAKEKQLTATQTSLQERQQKLAELEGKYAQDLQVKTLEESEKMTNAVYAFIREYNESHQQFDLILAKSFTSTPVLYGNPGMDITDEIIAGLNAEYEQVKKNK